MKIAILTKTFPPFSYGGTESYTKELAEKLACRDDLEVHVICFRDDEKPADERILRNAAEKAGYEVHIAGSFFRHFRMLRSLRNYYSVNRELKRILLEVQPDILQTIGVYSETVLGASIARKNDLAVVAFPRGSDIFRDLGYLKRTILKRFVFSRTDGLFLQSAYAKEFLVEKGLIPMDEVGSPNEAQLIRIIPNGMDPTIVIRKKGQIQDETRIRNRRYFTILWVGRFEPVKDPVEAVRIFEAFSKRVDDLTRSGVGSENVPSGMEQDEVKQEQVLKEENLNQDGNENGEGDKGEEATEEDKSEEASEEDKNSEKLSVDEGGTEGTGEGTIGAPKKRVRMVMVGDGSLYDEVHQLARHNHQISYLGKQDRNHVLKLMRMSDVLMNTSSSEGFPVTFLEAMASACPVFCFNVTANSEIIKDGVNGRVIKEGDTNGYVEALIHLFNDPIYGSTLAAQSYDRVGEYSWDTILEVMVPVYEELAAKAKERSLEKKKKYNDRTHVEGEEKELSGKMDADEAEEKGEDAGDKVGEEEEEEDEKIEEGEVEEEDEKRVEGELQKEIADGEGDVTETEDTDGISGEEVDSKGAGEDQEKDIESEEDVIDEENEVDIFDIDGETEVEETTISDGEDPDSGTTEPSVQDGSDDEIFKTEEDAAAGNEEEGEEEENISDVDEEIVEEEKETKFDDENIKGEEERSLADVGKEIEGEISFPDDREIDRSHANDDDTTHSDGIDLSGNMEQTDPEEMQEDIPEQGGEEYSDERKKKRNELLFELMGEDE